METTLTELTSTMQSQELITALNKNFAHLNEKIDELKTDITKKLQKRDEVLSESLKNSFINIGNDFERQTNNFNTLNQKLDSILQILSKPV